MDEEQDLFLDILDSEEESEEQKLKITRDKTITNLQARYFEENHWYYKYRIKVLKKLIDTYVKGENIRILDIGVGTGTLSKYLDEKGTCVHIEKDKESIEIASKLGMEIVEGSAPWDLPIDDEKFDYIILLNILEYVPNEDWFLSVLKSKLKDGGKVIVSTLTNPSVFTNNDKLNKIKRRYDKDTLEKKLIENGFKIKYETAFECHSSLKQILSIADKVLDEESFLLNEIPEDNNEQEVYFDEKEFPFIGTKELKNGNQIFLELEIIPEEERKENYRKLNEELNKQKLIDKVVDKIAETINK